MTCEAKSEVKRERRYRFSALSGVPQPQVVCCGAAQTLGIDGADSAALLAAIFLVCMC
jgi:hypothetical protein